MEVSVNYLSVIVAAVSSMVLGFLWFGPILGKQWIASMGWTEAEISAGREKMKKEGWKTYLIQAIGALVMAYVLSHVLVFATSYMQTSGLMAGLTSGFWMWLGFVAPVTVGVVLWDGKPWKLWFIQSGYYLVSLIVMGIIIEVWM
ncbi:MAG: hypothetical protein G01um10148_33 [Parcubacteria group bacterium Gr01-1014_8]|nr:MAG: hypothetical protein G01um10148_33 [Parcubacteria group bacterium Gr01-1014_8]